MVSLKPLKCSEVIMRLTKLKMGDVGISFLYLFSNIGMFWTLTFGKYGIFTFRVKQVYYVYLANFSINLPKLILAIGFQLHLILYFGLRIWFIYDPGSNWSKYSIYFD